MSDKEIAVGHQHSHGSMSSGLKTIFTEHGILGLWRGATGALTRVMIGSAAQLSTFSTALEYISKTKVISTRVLGRESLYLCLRNGQPTTFWTARNCFLNIISRTFVLFCYPFWTSCDVCQGF